MMSSYPYFNFPYYRRYSRYGYYYPHAQSYANTVNTGNVRRENVSKRQNSNTNRIDYSKIEKGHSGVMSYGIPFKQGAPTIDCSYTTKKEDCSSESEDSPLFQIFGINLYYDDILLVCLIFFLYQEGVKDEGLFIALILLLLS